MAELLCWASITEDTGLMQHNNNAHEDTFDHLEIGLLYIGLQSHCVADEGERHLRAEIKKLADELISDLPKDVEKELLQSGQTLENFLGKPGFMQVVNHVTRPIPEWGLNTKEMAAGCVLAMVESSIKGQDFDLLGYLEATACRYDLAANPPYHFHPDKLPDGTQITHLIFQVGISGTIRAMYIATHFANKTIFVHPFGGEWRKPTETEKRRILTERRSILIGVLPE